MRQLAMSLAAAGSLLLFAVQAPAAEQFTSNAAPVKSALLTSDGLLNASDGHVQEVHWRYGHSWRHPHGSYYWGVPRYSYYPYSSYYWGYTPYRSYHWGHTPYRSYYWGRPWGVYRW